MRKLPIVIQGALDIQQDSNFKTVIKTLQKHSPYILCLYNDKELRYYNKKEDYPKVLYISHIPQPKGEYLFEDESKNTYLIFGKILSTKFAPSATQKTGVQQSEKKLIIYDGESMHTFDRLNVDISIRRLI